MKWVSYFVSYYLWRQQGSCERLTQWTCVLLIITCYYCLDIISQRRLFHAYNLPHYSVIKSQVCQLSFTCEYRDDIALRQVFLGSTGQRPQFYACAHETRAFTCTKMHYILYSETYILSLCRFIRTHFKKGSSGKKFLGFLSISTLRLARSTNESII
jgi:hypothetical protein